MKASALPSTPTGFLREMVQRKSLHADDPEAWAALLRATALPWSSGVGEDGTRDDIRKEWRLFFRIITARANALIGSDFFKHTRSHSAIQTSTDLSRISGYIALADMHGDVNAERITVVWELWPRVRRINLAQSDMIEPENDICTISEAVEMIADAWRRE